MPAYTLYQRQALPMSQNTKQHTLTPIRIEIVLKINSRNCQAFFKKYNYGLIIRYLHHLSTTITKYNILDSDIFLLMIVF